MSEQVPETQTDPLAQTRELAVTIADVITETPAADTKVIDIHNLSTIADFFVICSGTSEPHLKAIAGEIETRLKTDHDMRPISIDGFPASQWIVLDYMQVIVHVFHRDKREFYSLEDLWGDAPRLAWEAPEERRQSSSLT